MGTVAADVRREIEQFELHPESTEGVIGRIGPHGSILLADGRKAALHADYLSSTLEPLASGDNVQCNLIATEHGLQAIDIAVIPALDIHSDRTGVRGTDTTHDLLAQAVLARDRGDYAEARSLYNRGLVECPSVQLVLSYAAMEKSRNRKSEAMRIYQYGIQRYPTMSKLREDAGMLAASIGRSKDAIELLTSALELCRTTSQGGEKGVLLALARVHYRQQESQDGLRTSLEYYRAAQRARSRKRSSSLSPNDRLAMNLAEIRLKHHRGNLAYRFLISCGFQFVQAHLHSSGLGADLVVYVDKPEMSGGYGISGNMFVRCVFKRDLTRIDLQDLDRAVRSDSSDDLITDQVVLLILASVPDALERWLFRRIGEQRDQKPPIVPLPQDVIEKEESGFSALDTVLGRWLYRRDLFKLNMPVVGRKFFGRERPMAALLDAISFGTPVGIFGLRKVGKTSLLKEGARRAIESGSIAVYIDLQTIPSDSTHDRWLYWRIANLLHTEVARQSPISGRMEWRIGGKYREVHEIPDNLPVASLFASDLSRLLDSIGDVDVSPRPKVILMLDEIEHLLSVGLRDTELASEGVAALSPIREAPVMRSEIFRFLGYLRGVVQESNGLFVLMITGANPAISELSQFRMEERPRDIRDNPVFDFFSEIYLPLLEHNECSLMIKELGTGMGLRFSNEARKLVYRMTGGHPFVTRRLCSFVSEQYPNGRPRIVTGGMVGAILDRYIQFSGHDFAEIMDRLDRDYPEQREICVRLANEACPMTIKDLGPSGTVNIKHLVGYQIVSINGDRVSLTMELLRKWLNQ